MVAVSFLFPRIRGPYGQTVLAPLLSLAFRGKMGGIIIRLVLIFGESRAFAGREDGTGRLQRWMDGWRF